MNNMRYENSDINVLKKQLKVYYPNITGALMHLVAHGPENQQFSSSKAHSAIAVKVLLDQTSKSDFIGKVDAFILDGVYFDKISENAIMTNSKIGILGKDNTYEYSTSFSSCPTIVESSGSITYGINKTFVRRAHDQTICIDHVPGFDTYLIGRAYYFEWEIRKRLIQTCNMTFEEAVQCNPSDYPNQTPYSFGPFPKTGSVSTSTSNIVCRDADLITIDKISIVKPQFDIFNTYNNILEENKELILKIGNYELPLQYVRNLPGGFSEDATHIHLHIPHYLLGYIPIYTMDHSISVEINGAPYEITYSKYSIPTKTAEFHKLYQCITQHTSVTQEKAYEMNIHIESSGITKGFFINADDASMFDNMGIISIFYNGIERLSYDDKLMKHYMYRVSPNMFYIPLSLLNDYEKCDRNSYQTGVNMSRIDSVQIRIISKSEFDIKKVRAYSISINSDTIRSK